ncbi:MAG: radical SAM protein [Chloroflexota bacterium]
MKNIRFVLVNPASPTWRVRPGEHPRAARYFRFSMLSSLYVAAAMPSYVQTRIIDEEVEALDFDMQADLVGISFMSYNAPRAYAIADSFRERGIPVIFGGYHPTFLPEEAKQHADAVCIGEAENNVPRMMTDFQAGQLQPFYRSLPVNLAGLAQPRRDLIRRKDYAPLEFLQATRGCNYQCSYCSVSAFNAHSLRTRPVEEVIDELKTLGRHVLFMDDNLIGNREYALELFRAMLPLGKTWFSQAGLGLAFDNEMLELATRCGCRGLFIGFETLSDAGLRGYNKKPNLGKDYAIAMRKLHAKGIAVCAAFMFGGDNDTSAVFQRTLEFMLDSNVETLQATRLTPFPGTPLFAEMDAQGRILDKDWSHYDFNHVVFEPQQMSRETLDKGVSWVLRQFHSRTAIARRAWRSLQYLGPGFSLAAVLPINLGWRYKLTVDGNYARGAEFEGGSH